MTCWWEATWGHVLGQRAKGVSWKERHPRSDPTLSEESTEEGGILDRRNRACQGLEG